MGAFLPIYNNYDFPTLPLIRNAIRLSIRISLIGHMPTIGTYSKCANPTWGYLAYNLFIYLPV